MKLPIEPWPTKLIECVKIVFNEVASGKVLKEDIHFQIEL